MGKSEAKWTPVLYCSDGRGDPVGDDLPNDGQSVLIWPWDCEDTKTATFNKWHASITGVGVGQFISDNHRDDPEECRPTHWRPLPEGPDAPEQE